MDQTLSFEEQLRAVKTEDGRTRLSFLNLHPEQRKQLLTGGGGVLGMIGGYILYANAPTGEGEEVIDPAAELGTLIGALDTTDFAPPPPPDTTVPPPTPGPTIIIYTDAPFSHQVTDDMSFNQAFATARADIGMGGYFEWNGKLYGTYYKEEWDAMTPQQHEQYWASVDWTMPIEEPIVEPDPIKIEDPIKDIANDEKLEDEINPPPPNPDDVIGKITDPEPPIDEDVVITDPEPPVEEDVVVTEPEPPVEEEEIIVEGEDIVRGGEEVPLPEEEDTLTADLPEIENDSDITDMI